MNGGQTGVGLRTPVCLSGPLSQSMDLAFVDDVSLVSLTLGTFPLLMTFPGANNTVE